MCTSRRSILPVILSVLAACGDPPAAKHDAGPDPDVANACTNGVQDNDETGVDCGGPCPACEVIDLCVDGIQNGAETGVDCGGSCAACPTPLDTTTPYDFGDAVGFLYEGTNPYQTGVVPGTIDRARIAVIRGRVVDRADMPVSGVRVSVHGRAEYGSAKTRADGTFDFVVNGGGLLTLDFDKTGLLPVQRKAVGPIRDWTTLDDIVVIALDSKVTAIDFSAPMQVHQGTMQTDLDGDRTATLMFSSGTTAMMEVGGTMQPLTSLHVRSTEYTVGGSGARAMPGELPPSSGYTYAVELSVDEAIAAGATKVVFSKPVVTHVQNFLKFPTGGRVPLGYYDRETAQWVPADDGRVIEIISITGGMADLDVTGSGTASTQAELDALGVTTEERTQLATLYTAGTSLWRTSIDHFTPWDMNWPYGPPDDAIAPDGEANMDVEPDDDDDEPDEDCPDCEGGSEIEAQNGNLGERLPIAGTTLGLKYRSQRVPGPPPAIGQTAYRHTLKATVSNAMLPPSCLGIVVEFNVGGRRYVQQFSPTPELRVTQAWDGRDIYGRTPTSALPVSISIGYRYPAVYRPVPSDFARSFNVPRLTGAIGFAAEKNRAEITIFKHAYSSYSKVESLGRSSAGRWLATNVELGGFTLDVHHTWDPSFRTLERGDGPRRSVIRLTETGAYLKDMGIQARDVAFDADGTLYGINKNQIWRKKLGGPFETIAGADNPNDLSEGDGGPALAALLNRPRFLAVGPDGSVYFTEWRQLVRRILPNGTIVRFAGATSMAKLGEGVLATEAYVNAPAGITVGRDGTVYFIDRFGATFSNPPRPPGLRSITTDGRFHYLAAIDFRMDGLQLAPGGPLVADNDGNLFVGDGGLAKIRLTGAVEHPIGQITAGFYTLNRGVGLLPSGSIFTADVSSVYEKQKNGALARVPMLSVSREPLPYPSARVSPAGDVYIMGYTLATQSNYETLNLHSNLYLYEPVKRYDAGDALVPSENGEEVYWFDAKGRHMKTTSQTGVELWKFAYDSAGRLISVTDRNDLVTTIDRDANGKFLGFTAPGGQKTIATLDSDGYLTKLAYPAGDTYELGYDAGGMLVSLKDRKGGMHSFQYDARGRLTRDTDAANFAKLRSSTFTYPISIGRSVSFQTGGGRTRGYKTSLLATGAVAQSTVRTTISPAGGTSTISLLGDKTARLRYEEGTLLKTTMSPDLRWGMHAPVNESYDMTTPSGKFLQVTHTRDVTLAVPVDPLSVTSLVDAFAKNGKTQTTTYDVQAHTLTTVWPSGRTAVRTLDAKERPVLVNGDTSKITSPIGFSYDIRGRLAAITGGGVPQTFAYDAQDRLISSTDSLGRTTELTYDLSDRLSSLKLPSGRTFTTVFDPAGNLMSMQMPNGTMHTLAHDARDLWTSYTAGTSNPMTAMWDGDKNPTKLTLSDGRAIDYTYDSGDRLIGGVYAEATIDATFDDETTRVSSVTRTPTSTGLAQTMAFNYDGSQVTRIAHSGAANGVYTLTYNSELQLAGISLDGGATRAYTRDLDDHLIALGPFTYTRGGPGGALSVIKEGAATILSLSFDGTGRESSRVLTAGTTSYLTATSFDAARQPATTMETIAGKNRAYAYTYDLDGQLTKVQRTDLDTATTSCEVYAYDDNGNRTSKKWGTCGSEENTETATYDAVDRIMTRGATTYTLDAAGFMTARGGDSFVYSARGELLHAAIAAGTPSEQLVDYSYDANGRRVRRTSPTSTTEYLYASASDFYVTHSRNTVTGLSEYFYDEAGRLYAVTRGGSRYFVGTDAIGTPRIVVNAAGTVIVELEYDAFGRLVSGDPNAFELPVGFGGGIPDPITGLVRLGYRDYDPAAGRFTARDPALFKSGQLNFYTYAQNEPIRRIDRTGLASTLCDALEQLAKYEEKKGGPLPYALSVLPFTNGMTSIGDGNTNNGTFEKDKIQTFQGVDMNYFETTYAGNKVLPNFGAGMSQFGNITQNLLGFTEGHSLAYTWNNVLENERGVQLGNLASKFPNIEAFRQAMCECTKK